MEIFKEAWTAIVAALGGVSLAGIISAIIYGCLKGAFSKTINKINVDDIAEKATNKGIEQVKKISYTQSIQPVVESELKKVTETANEYLKKQVAEMNANYEKLLTILVKFAAYFDDSIGVPESKKEELHEAIAEVVKDTPTAQTIVVEEITEEKPNAVSNGKKSTEKAVAVER